MTENRCQSCPKHFSSNEELKEHALDYQLRVTRAVERVNACQSRLKKAIHILVLCMRHEDGSAGAVGYDELASDGDGDSDSDSDGDLDFDSRYVRQNKDLQCPQPGCGGGSFDRKSLRRHYETHVQCAEECPFCGKTLVRVSQAKRHRHECQKAKRKDTVGSQRNLERAEQQRVSLAQSVSTQLSQAMRLMAGSGEELSEHPGSPSRKRKRARQLEADGSQYGKPRGIAGAPVSYALHVDPAAGMPSPQLVP
ncbi:hypothetical protein B0H66DRAFT_570725 [Apodospora peruviana]|uniref:C2H2-type domain-containing protein n=1 Tax=Apodospora peruviana TaxID=516989 RepID=A0AAE0HTB8_9PEZI|nr:hypothetical protein B0H66DRAFT_570725 [Apodospora peruviana]